MPHHLAPSIPIVDFSGFRHGNAAEKRAVADQLRKACCEFGFVYLNRVGFDPDEIEGLFSQVRYFFNLPLEQKQRVARSPDTNCGYVAVESERLNPTRPGDLKEAFNVGLQTIWPPQPEGFCADVSSFYNTCVATVAPEILQAFAIALGLAETFFEHQHGRNSFLRLLHYPPLPPSIRDTQIRAGEHTDYGSFTLLLQDDMGGLEIQLPSGEWLAAPYHPNTVVLNVGDALQRWTNDTWRSTLHRVVNPVGENATKSRYSVAFFCDPNPEVEITCLPTCQSAGQPPRHPPVLSRDYLERKFAETYGV